MQFFRWRMPPFSGSMMPLMQRCCYMLYGAHARFCRLLRYAIRRLLLPRVAAAVLYATIQARHMPMP